MNTLDKFSAACGGILDFLVTALVVVVKFSFIMIVWAAIAWAGASFFGVLGSAIFAAVLVLSLYLAAQD